MEKSRMSGVKNIKNKGIKVGMVISNDHTHRDTQGHTHITWLEKCAQRKELADRGERNGFGPHRQQRHQT